MSVKRTHAVHSSRANQDNATFRSLYMFHFLELQGAVFSFRHYFQFYLQSSVCPVDEDLGEVDVCLEVNVEICVPELLVDASFLPREVLVEFSASPKLQQTQRSSFHSLRARTKLPQQQLQTMK